MNQKTFIRRLRRFTQIKTMHCETELDSLLDESFISGIHYKIKICVNLRNLRTSGFSE